MLKWEDSRKVQLIKNHKITRKSISKSSGKKFDPIAYLESFVLSIETNKYLTPKTSAYFESFGRKHCHDSSRNEISYAGIH